MTIPSPPRYKAQPLGDGPRRYGELVARWHTLTPAQWDAILQRVLIRCIDDAVAAARPVCEGKPYWPQVEAACTQCQAAIKSGDKVAARAAADAAEAAGARAARAAAGAARAAAGAAGARAAGAAYRSLFTFVLDQIEAAL